MYLYGDLFIKVDSDSVDVLPRGVPPFRLFTQLGNGHTPSMVVPAFGAWHGNVHAVGSSSLEWEVLRDVRVYGSSCGTCRDVLHSHFDRKHHAAWVLASLCRVMVNVSLPMVLFMA